MLRLDDIVIHTGRAFHGGDFTEMEHLPTGIKRRHPGPLRNVDQQELRRVWIAEIEVELVAQGRTEFLVPTDQT